MMSGLIAALHFLGAFGVVATVFSEWIIFSRQPTWEDARRLQRLDAWYGLSAIAVFVAGLLRVYVFEKGSRFYLSNPVFLTKIGLFIGVGLLSIYPTMQFIRWRKATRVHLAPTLDAHQASMIGNILRLE